MTLLAVVLALAAGAGFAMAAALQHHSARQEETTALGDPRLLVRLARRPLWLAANALDLVAVVAQGAALRVGAIVLVQPLLVSGLILAVPAEAMLNRRRASRRDLIGVMVGGLALAAFVLIADPGGGVDTPSDSEWAVTLLWCGMAAAGCIGAASLLSGAARAACLGAATGVSYGVTAALLKTIAEGITHPLTLLGTWEIYVLAAVGLGGFLLNQNVYQAAGLAAGLTTITLVEPIVALIVGLTAFHEHLDASGPRGVGLAASGAGIVAGIVLVTAGQQARETIAPDR